MVRSCSVGEGIIRRILLKCILGIKDIRMETGYKLVQGKV
jgi:hypothetical protein